MLYLYYKDGGAYMRLALYFELARNEMDSDYRRIFMHFIKECINNVSDGRYYQKYYGQNRQKEFSFAVFFDRPQFRQNKILLESNKIKMVFTTSDTKLGMIFWNSFIAYINKAIPLSNQNEMTLTGVYKTPEQEVKSQSILVKTMSPLVIRDHNKEGNKDFYYSVAFDNFSDIAGEIIRSQLNSSGYSKQYVDGFSITPVKAKKAVINHYGCKIEASIGEFELCGRPLVLNYLLKAGVGSRHNEGFGAFQLISEMQEVEKQNA